MDKGSTLYNKSLKSLLQDNNIEIYSAHYEGNLLLLKDILELWKLKSANTWLQYQKICILIHWMI